MSGGVAPSLFSALSSTPGGKQSNSPHIARSETVDVMIIKVGLKPQIVCKRTLVVALAAPSACRRHGQRALPRDTNRRMTQVRLRTQSYCVLDRTRLLLGKGSHSKNWQRRLTILATRLLAHLAPNHLASLFVRCRWLASVSCSVDTRWAFSISRSSEGVAPPCQHSGTPYRIRTLQIHK